MGGDGMGGLALAIGGAMLAILLVTFGLPFWIGKRIARGRGHDSGKQWLVGLGSGLVGVLVGLLIVTATFYEDAWAPPPLVRFVTPPGFAHKWVILLEDRSARTEIKWSGIEIPFFGKRTQITMPPSGILRVKDFGPMGGRADTDVIWSDGAQSFGSGGGPGPPGTGAQSYGAFSRDQAGSDPPGHLPFDQEAMATYILARERGGRAVP